MDNLKGKRVLLYARVSTTEQKDKGYSLPQQKDYLMDFCNKHECEVVQYYEEDYTGSHFDRPEFKKLIKLVSQKKEHIDFVLVYNWDRYARNCSMSYHYLKFFQSHKIELNSITQWIDFKDPSHGMNLGIHFLMPDVDNQVRAYKTKIGIIGALKEGRFINRAPIGYKNGKDSFNTKKPLIRPCPEKGILIEQIFNDYSTGNYSQEELRIKYRRHGIKLSKSQFSEMLSNVIYIGKVVVPAHDEKAKEIIEGLHQAIVDERVFYTVQKIKANKSNYKTKTKSVSVHEENLPLRGGYLKCPRCGANMTGSPSKSRNNSYYYYYHCNKKRGCKENVPAELVNAKFLDLLRKIKPSPSILKLFREVLIDQYQVNSTTRLHEIKKNNEKKSQIEASLDKLTEKFVEGDLERDSYVRLKEKYNQQLNELKFETEDLSEFHKDLEKFLEFGTNLISDIDLLYTKAAVEVKRKIIGSIFSEMLVFEKNEYRTAIFNDVILLMSKFNNTSQEFIKRKRGLISKTSYSVPGAGVEPK